MSRKFIYFIYILILFSAIGFKTVKAYSPEKKEYKPAFKKDKFIVESVSVEELNNGSRVVFKLGSLFKPIVDYYKKDNSLVLDFYDADISPMVVDAFLGRGVKLGYVTSLSGKIRAKLFMEANFRASVAYSGKSVVVSVKEKEKIVAPVEKEKLLKPGEAKYSQAVIRFENSLLEPVVSKLASEAGVEIQFEGNIPDRFTAEFEAPTPFEAIKKIALMNNLRLYRSGKVWYMTSR